MANDPKVTFALPFDYLARFPDGDYTVGRGADPRSAAERAADPDGSVAMEQFEVEQEAAVKKHTASSPVEPSEAAE